MTATSVTREARCSCGSSKPSSELRGDFFFQDRSAGTQDHVCKNCRYHEVAHERKQRTGERHLGFVCDNFEAMTEGYDFDVFYDGCRGWD